MKKNILILSRCNLAQSCGAVARFDGQGPHCVDKSRTNPIIQD